MTRSGAYLAYQLQRLGWPLTAGLILIVAAAAFYLAVGTATEHRMHRLQQQVAGMRGALAERRQAWVPASPQAALQTFYRSLPPERTAPDLLEKIFDAAYENDLAPEQGELKLELETDAAFLRYRIVLPVSGNYAAIRAFVNRVLREIPTAALDDIGFSRKDAKNPEVEARVRFTLYLGVER